MDLLSYSNGVICKVELEIILYKIWGTRIKPITATRPYCSHPGFSDLKINKEKAFFQIFNDRKIPYSFSFPEVPWSVRSHQYPLLY